MQDDLHHRRLRGTLSPTTLHEEAEISQREQGGMEPNTVCFILIILFSVPPKPYELLLSYFSYKETEAQRALANLAQTLDLGPEMPESRLKFFVFFFPISP